MSTTLKMANGDLLKDAAGRYVLIDQEEKCAQDMAESLLNNYNPEKPEWYNGSELWRLTHGGETPVFSPQISIRDLIYTYVEESIGRLMDLQDIDPYVDDEERITEILDLEVRQIGIMTWVFFLICLTDANEPAKVGFEIDLNQQLPAALLGDVPSTLDSVISDVAKSFL